MTTSYRLARFAGVLLVGVVLSGYSGAQADAAVFGYREAVLSAGPVRYYRLGDLFGTTAADATGTANGTYTNFTNPADFGQPGALASDADPSVRFDGVNDLVTVPSAADLNITGDLTIEFWMNKESEASDWQRLVGKGTTNVRTYGVWEEAGAGKRLLFQQYNGSGGAVVNFYSSKTIDTNQWYHVVATVQGNTAKIYVDGVLDTQATRSGTVGTDSDPLTLGKGPMHTYFPGRLDEVAIYGKALTAGQVKYHYNLAKGYSYPQIVQNSGASTLYQFEDPSSANGATVDDSIGSNDATYGGTCTLVPSFNDIFGNAVSFNGTSDYIRLPAGPFGAYPTSGSTNSYVLSFETWFRSTDDGAILGQTGAGSVPGVSGASGWVPAIYLDAAGIVRASIFYHGGSTERQILSTVPYNDGVWHHLVDVYNNGTETLYLDGKLIGTQTFAEYGYAAGYDYYLGTAYAQNWPNVGGLVNNWFFFNGQLENTAIYPIALSAADVEAHYLATLVPEPSALALWALAIAGLVFATGRRRT